MIKSLSKNQREKRDSNIRKPWAHLMAGGAGGMVAALITSPLDVLKTRLQSDFYQGQPRVQRIRKHKQNHPTFSILRAIAMHFRETHSILTSIPRTEGYRALFKGLGPTLSGIIPASAIKFYTYGNGKRIISDKMNGGKETAWVHLLAAAIAGFTVCTATNPIWVVRTRLQLDKSSLGNRDTFRYRGSFDCAFQIIRNEGFRSLYRGLSASYLGVTETALQWVLYEQMKVKIASRQDRKGPRNNVKSSFDQTLNWGGNLFAAGGAKLLAALLTYPHEVIRTRLRQNPNSGEKQKYTSLVQCCRMLLRKEGFASLYGGLIPHLLRVVPSAAITFGVYESILRILSA